MNNTDPFIPSGADVRVRLQSLRQVELAKLCVDSGVSLSALLKLRGGQTTNPGVDTVRAIWANLPGEAKPEAQAEAPTPN